MQERLLAQFPWKRTILAIAALLAPFFFPWPVALAFVCIIALFIPLIAIPVGVLFDALYYAGTGFMYFTLVGIGIAILAQIVHQFVKTRII